jgi:hypothetical protein
MAIHLTSNYQPREPAEAEERREFHRQLLNAACERLKVPKNQRQDFISELSKIAAKIPADEKACKDSQSQEEARAWIKGLIELFRQVETRTASPRLAPALALGGATFVFGEAGRHDKNAQLNQNVTEYGRAGGSLAQQLEEQIKAWRSVGGPHQNVETMVRGYPEWRAADRCYDLCIRFGKRRPTQSPTGEFAKLCEIAFQLAERPIPDLANLVRKVCKGRP